MRLDLRVQTLSLGLSFPSSTSFKIATAVIGLLMLALRNNDSGCTGVFLLLTARPPAGVDNLAVPPIASDRQGLCGPRERTSSAAQGGGCRGSMFNMAYGKWREAGPYEKTIRQKRLVHELPT